MIEKRKWAMNEAGLVLLDNFDGKFLNVVSSAEKSAKKLIEIILQNFSSYRDETFYSGAKGYLIFSIILLYLFNFIHSKEMIKIYFNNFI